MVNRLSSKQKLWVRAPLFARLVKLLFVMISLRGMLNTFFSQQFDNIMMNFLFMNENASSIGNSLEPWLKYTMFVKYFYSILDYRVLMVDEWKSFTLCLFFIGLGGFIFNRTHVILALIAGELLILSAFLNFIFAAHYYSDPMGYVYASILLAIAACEASLGLSLVINLFKVKKTVALTSITYLHG